MNQINPKAPLIALALAFSTQAMAVEQLSLNFEKIRFDYSPQTANADPFAIVITINPDGSVDGAIPGMHKSTDVTLKRGVFQSAGPAGSLTELKFAGGPHVRVFGSLTVVSVDAANLSLAIDPQYRLGPAAATDAVIFHMDRESYGEHIELRFSANENGWLTGYPTALFGPSGTGKTLAASIPMPAEGAINELSIEVVDETGAGVRIPVTIKHGI